MNFVGITQRVDIVPAYGERRDCLDQRWWQFNEELNITLIPLPNDPTQNIDELAANLKLSGVILSGGNTIADPDATAADAAPERDAFETALITWAISKNIPVLGICRGAQMINHFFNGTTSPVDNHVAKNHDVSFLNDWSQLPIREVNSYHNQAIDDDTLSPALIPLAKSVDGTVEAFRHETHNITGIMWHPERETAICAEDLKIMKDILV